MVAVELDHIVVLPEKMPLEKDDLDFIDSVTAHYNDETKDEIYLGDCDYKSSDTDVAKIDKLFSSIMILALEAGEADITVSYTEGGITKTDIVEVTVTAPVPDPVPPVPMELIVAMPATFTTVEETAYEHGYGHFTVEIVANDDADKLVEVYFTFPAAEAGSYVVEGKRVEDEKWVDLRLEDDTGEIEIVLGDPFLLINETLIFRTQFTEVDTYEITVEVRPVPGGDALCEEDITIVVDPRNDATLESLTYIVDGVGDPIAVDLSPGVTGYDVELESMPAAGIVVDAEATDFNATFIIAQADIPAAEETTTAIVVVTAEDGETKLTYTVNFIESWVP
ncbi:hypothetical protein ES708_28609 [subsurface metagenome]